MTKELVYEQVKPKSLAGRKTNLQRLELKAAEATATKRLEIEAQRVELRQPDTKGTALVSDILAYIALGSAFLIAYFVLIDVASWMKLPLPALQLIVPGIVEVVILFCQFDYIRSESRVKGSGRVPFWTMLGLVSVAVVAQGGHTVVEWGSHFGSFQSWVGLILAAASPLIIVYVSKRLTILSFAKGE